jgi:hypothetical protein
MVVEPTGFVTILQQIDIKSGSDKDIGKKPVIIDDFMIRCRMVTGTRTSDPCRFLILGIGKIGVRDRDPEVSSRRQPFEAQCGGSKALGFRQMLPDMFAQKRIRGTRLESAFPGFGYHKIQIFLLGGHPAGPSL